MAKTTRANAIRYAAPLSHPGPRDSPPTMPPPIRKPHGMYVPMMPQIAHRVLCSLIWLTFSCSTFHTPT